MEAKRYSIRVINSLFQIGYASLRCALVITLVAGLVACNSDVRGPINPQTDVASNQNTGIQTTGAANNGLYSLRVGNGGLSIVEGEQATVSISIERSNLHSRTITLAAEGQSQTDADDLSWQFSDTSIDANENTTQIQFYLNIGAQPITPQSRTIRVIGTDGASQSVVALLTLSVTPTSRPDVYLLVGQSNMVGFSEFNAKLTAVGQPDQSHPRIKQLNVTGNDAQNFRSPADFQNAARIAVASPRFTDAVDPLHAGFDSRINGKEGTNIGLGLSFAKRALQNTTADIYLVPAAWADSGFCKRSTNLYPELGWLASSSNSADFAGSLLHDRAIARANLTLEETGGILRGILWHQGEADSDSDNCAVNYESNLQAMVASFRSKIIQDARGAEARGSNAAVPFVLGTMSKGGVYSEFTNTKLIVDGVHRNVGNSIPYAAVVNSDDLVPNDYPCGEGSCIHFGASAYREMGNRYYDRLQNVLNR